MWANVAGQGEGFGFHFLFFFKFFLGGGRRERGVVGESEDPRTAIHWKEKDRH